MLLFTPSERQLHEPVKRVTRRPIRRSQFQRLQISRTKNKAHFLSFSEMGSDRDVSEKRDFSPKLEKLKLFLEKNTKKLERETQENLNRQREAEKELVRVRFLNWAIAKSGQENLLYSQKYALEEENQVTNIFFYVG